MDKKIKKSRKAIKNYTFNSDEGDVKIDLNNYTATCSLTGNPKSFYHSYLANLIKTKYDNNFSTFEKTYVSREGKGQLNSANKVDQIKDQIDKAAARLASLKEKLAQMETAS